MRSVGASRVVCLGDVMVDVLAQLPGPLAIGSDVPAPVRIQQGGSAANTASWLGWLGVPVTLAGKVGDDEFGRVAAEALRAVGVELRLAIDPAQPTGICLVLVTPDGERTMVPSTGANATLTAGELADPPLLRAGDRLHLSGYALLNQGSREGALTALALAGRLAVPVSVDAASAAPLRAVGGAAFLDWLPAGTLLLANSDELAALTGDDPAGASALLDRGLTTIVKLGSSGARLVTPAGSVDVPGDQVEVRDSTGAGDAFAAGVLGALVNGVDLPGAVGAGNQLGAHAVGLVGGRPAR
ncbi:MAG: sugar kinase [Jatrophihabitantaceae bacterium]